MELPPLSGAQKTKLRGLGQRLQDMLLVGQAGITPTVLTELNRLLDSHELVKLRFVGSDRNERAALAEEISANAPCVHVGSVGGTALFFRPNADPEKSKITL